MILAGFFFLLGALAGGALVWLLARRGDDRLGAQIESQIERTLPRVAEAVLAPKAQQLERAAGQELKLLGADTVSQVKVSQAGLQETLEGMRQRLDSYQARITAFELERAGAEARMQQQVEALAGAGTALRQEAQSLRQALTSSDAVRGAWGEAALKGILTRCGLSEHADFDLQVSLSAGATRLRPDVVIHLPSGRELAIDAKASLTDFLAGVEQADEARRQECFRAFAQVLRARARELAGKEYARNLENGLPFVVMFVPGEGAFRAALDADPDLCAYGQSLQPQVALTSPSTLFPMLALIAHDWQQHAASRKMQELLEEVAEFGRRLQIFLGHLQRVGKGLDAAGKAYNEALGSYRSRLLPRWQHLQDLKAGWEEAEELKPVENLPRLTEAAAAGEGREGLPGE